MLTKALDGEVCIVGAARTPMGSFNGGLAPLTAPELGSVAIKGKLSQPRVILVE